MSNKIGFKNTSYKDENYQVAIVQKEVASEDRMADALQQMGFQKAVQLLRKFMYREITHGDVLARELTEVRKHFFDT